MATYEENVKQWIEEESAFYDKETTDYVDQSFLRWKAAWSALAEEKAGQGKLYLKTAKSFYFRELLVNLLMKLAWKKGVEYGKEQSFQAGYDKAMDEVYEKLAPLIGYRGPTA